jgi:hypothetical protein
MEISLKKAAAIVLAGAAGLGAMTASADVVLPGTGNGELTLFVRNDTTGAVYARGLGVQVDNVLTQADIVGSPAQPGATPKNYLLPTIGPDAALTAFLNGSDSFSWTIMAGDNTGALTAGAKRYLTTTQLDLTNGTSVTGANLATSYNNLNQMLTTLNDFLPDTSGSSVSANGQWRQTGAVPGSGAGDWYGIGPNNVNSLGSAANFYMLSSNGTGAARVFQFADVRLSANGTLSSVSAVPLPAAVWLLGSGLVGLAGIGRRRKSA